MCCSAPCCTLSCHISHKTTCYNSFWAQKLTCCWWYHGFNFLFIFSRLTMEKTCCFRLSQAQINNLFAQVVQSVPLWQALCIIRGIFLNSFSISTLSLGLPMFHWWVLKILVVMHEGSSLSSVYRYENFYTSSFFSRFTFIVHVRCISSCGQWSVKQM